MKASELTIPKESLDERPSPNTSETRTEYAVRVGGIVLSHKRFATPTDAYFFGVALGNAIDRERCGRVLVKRDVVMRRVCYGEWESVEGGTKCVKSY